jgi:hypothetical protein
MEIRIENGAEFQKLLDQLADELQQANIHLKLYGDLIDAREEYSVEFAQANAFWALTVQSHLDAAIFRLCKIYDQHSRSLNLRNLLDTIKANLSIFDLDNFRERLKGNPFVDSMSAEPRKPDPQQLQADLNFISESNPAVKALIVWRNNYFAHRSAAHAINNTSVADTHPLSIKEVENLLAEGMAILNRYSGLFWANYYSTDIIGRDDFRSVLEAVREHLKTIDRRVQEDIERLEKGGAA